MDRRNFFHGTAAAAVTGAMAGCAAPMGMQGSARIPFTVAGTMIPVVGSDEMYPVRRIYCIGRNYRAHSIEMGSNPDREPPFFFQKPIATFWIASVGFWKKNGGSRSGLEPISMACAR